MRNPLNAILHCAAELIELLTGMSPSLPNDDRASAILDCLEASRTIVYCGRHQKRIIDDVLTLSKLDSNLLSISPMNTWPLDVVDEVLKVFDTELRTSSIQTRTELAGSFNALGIRSVLVDSHRLIQVLINLVANAIKFTKGESLRNLQILVGAYTEEPVSSEMNGGVRYVPSGRALTDPTGAAEWGTGETVFLSFSVKDTGPGMTREEADLLFNRFIQGSPRTHAQYGGSGLGLWISRELAELHGGRIGISSELGLGSTFDFYVKGRRSTKSIPQPVTLSVVESAAPPRRPASTRHISAGRPPISSTKSAASILQPPSMLSSLHVLIVEDNLINQTILAKLMRKQGYNVSIANHGGEALDIIQASTWNSKLPPSPAMILTELDVILCDIEMPVMDGKAFVRRVRLLQSEGNLSVGIPVIAVTGNARGEQIQQAKECGFDDVVSKPYRVEDLMVAIRRYTVREK